MTFQACYAHSDFPRQNCPDCHALRTSLSLKGIYADIEDARIRAQMEPLREKWGKRDMARDGDLERLLEDVVRQCRGDVS